MSDEPLTVEINGVPITASMEEWRRVLPIIHDRCYEDHKAARNVKRRAGQVWYALYDRHQHAVVEECFSYDEAHERLYSDGAELAAYGIVHPDGHFEANGYYSKHADEVLADFADELAEARAETARLAAGLVGSEETP